MSFKRIEMKGKYYHKSRGIHLILSTLFLLAVLIFLQTSLAMKFAFLITGIGLGYVLGYFDWNKTKSRINRRNVVILYATDSGFYSILLLLFLIQFAPRSITSFLKVIQGHPFILPFLIGFVTSSWAAYSFAIWRGVKQFESAHGRLITKKFWSRSLVGQEGFISKQGVVIEECAPIGKVRIGSEVWNAESIDKKKIGASDRIIVRDIEGLKLIVEKVIDA